VLLVFSWDLWTMAVLRDVDVSPSSELGEAVHEAAAEEWRDKEEVSETNKASELALDILTISELGLFWDFIGKTGAGGNGNIVPDLAVVEMELVETGGLVDIEGSKYLNSAELVLVSLDDALA